MFFSVKCCNARTNTKTYTKSEVASFQKYRPKIISGYIQIPNRQGVQAKEISYSAFRHNMSIQLSRTNIGLRRLQKKTFAFSQVLFILNVPLQIWMLRNLSCCYYLNSVSLLCTNLRLVTINLVLLANFFTAFCNFTSCVDFNIYPKNIKLCVSKLVLQIEFLVSHFVLAQHQHPTKKLRTLKIVTAQQQPQPQQQNNHNWSWVETK